MRLCRRTHFVNFFSLVWVSTAFCISSVAAAQDAIPPLGAPSLGATLVPREENGRQIYDVAQFTRFAPQTAADMVRQIPGFSVTSVSSDRGLGEASQNVLINGQRISGKSNDANSVLQRIAASDVTRIEIVDGTTLDIPGLRGQVLNLVAEQGTLSGNFSWRAQIRERLPANVFGGSINLSGKLGKGAFTLALKNNDAFRSGGWGPELVTDSAGNLLFTRDIKSRFIGDRPNISGSYSVTSDAGSIWNINGSVEHFRFRREREFDRFAPGTADIFEIDTGREDVINYEISSDYDFDFAGGRLKLIGYHRFEHSPFTSIFRRDFTDGRSAQATRFERTVDAAETVTRAEYGWKAGKTDWQISMEGAYNYLDAVSELFQLDNGDQFQPVPLPNATARVEEKRGQLVLSYGRPLSESLTLQATLGGEYSRLSQTGENGKIRSFWRPKASVSLALKASSRLDVSTRVQRKVGQLNFGSFLASVNVQNNNNNAGNPDLVPPQSWLGELEVKRSLGKAGSLKLKGEAEFISDIVDQIPISATKEAPGNIPHASRYRAEATASLLLDAIGFNGAKIDLELALQKTRLTDPLTGEQRSISNRLRHSWQIDVRHDVPGTDWAWGVFASQERSADFFRLNYRSRDWTTLPFTSAFIEHKNLWGLKVRGQVMNLIGQQERSRETFYVARRDGPVNMFEDTINHYGVIYRLNVSGTF